MIRISGEGVKRFTVRKMSDNIGVERIFPLESPFIDSITVNKHGKVRRAKLYYLRNLTGKKARIKRAPRSEKSKSSGTTPLPVTFSSEKVLPYTCTDAPLSGARTSVFFTLTMKIKHLIPILALALAPCTSAHAEEHWASMAKKRLR